VACVASALYGADLWWDDQKGSGVKKRYDELQTLENQLGRAKAGNFRTTNLGVESGLREHTEQKQTPRAEADVVTQRRPCQVPTRLRYSHGTTDGPLQRVLRTGGRPTEPVFLTVPSRPAATQDGTDGR